MCRFLPDFFLSLQFANDKKAGVYPGFFCGVVVMVSFWTFFQQNQQYLIKMSILGGSWSWFLDLFTMKYVKSPLKNMYFCKMWTFWNFFFWGGVVRPSRPPLAYTHVKLTWNTIHPTQIFSFWCASRAKFYVLISGAKRAEIRNTDRRRWMHIESDNAFQHGQFTHFFESKKGLSSRA